MISLRTAGLAALSMLAFAANSPLCRLALKSTGMDTVSFTAVRLAAGAALLGVLLWRRGAPARQAGSWLSALVLSVYALAFSFAYVRLPAGVGALILFGSVQATMIGYGLSAGERLRPGQIGGLCLAVGGLVYLLLPGLSAPPPGSAAVMVCAGAAWGTYSLRGRGVADATAATAGNFLRAAPFAALAVAVWWGGLRLPAAGVWAAVGSGAVASGLGYIVWYSVLPRLAATQAGIIQLSVPVLTALGGVSLLREPLTPRLAVSAAVILGGIAVVILGRR